MFDKKEWYKQNREKVLARVKEYHQNNKAKRSAKAKEHYKNNEETYKNNAKKYYGLNRIELNKKRLENNKEYREKHKDTIKRYYEKNREIELIRAKTKWHFRNKKKKCQDCGSNKQLQFHHLQPYKKDNFIVLCRKCHLKLHGKEVLTNEV